MAAQNKYAVLEERPLAFSLHVKSFCKQFHYDFIEKEYIRQLIRSAGSVVANYLEANEHLGPNDLKMRLRIAKKEAKESILWLKHLETDQKQIEETRNALIKEAIELMNIFGAILKKLD